MLFSVPRNAWLRSPNPGNANNERNVNTDGSLNNNNANNSNGASADCGNSQIRVVERRKQYISHKERPSYSLEGVKNIGDKGVPRDSPFISTYLIMSYENIISFNSLYRGLKKSCKNIRWKDSTVGYEANALKNTYKLRQSLLSGKYKIDKYQRFTIYEPKKRDIIATRIKDRQFQRSLCDNGLYEEITKSFIHDNCACLRGRGVDYTLNRITAHLRRYYNKNRCAGWVLKCDIHHYFQSISHSVAKAAITKRVKDPDTAFRACEIIDSFDGDTGIGLGSQVSQLVALAVLDDLDHYIKERLGVKHYVRYMDDFVLIHPDKEFLKTCKKEIEHKLAEIGLKLNKKTSLYPIKQGMKMLQWKFILTDTGRIIKKWIKKNKASNAES